MRTWPHFPRRATRRSICVATMLLAALFFSAPLGAASVPSSHEVVVADARAPGEVSLRLVATPLSVFAPDARLVLKTGAGDEQPLPRPDRKVFALRGANGERGLLREVRDDAVSGWLQTRDGFQRLDGYARRPLHSRAMALDEQGDEVSFECAHSDLDAPEEATLRETMAQLVPPLRTPASANGGATSFRARLAIETDNEFLSKFSDATEATDYVQALIGFISVIYEDEIDTLLEVGFLRLWEAPDPFAQTSTKCLLYEAGRYWNQNEAATARTAMHLLSGKASNSGLAWVGVLCNGGFSHNHEGTCPGLTPNADAYGGAYGITSGIDGDFNGSSGILWDVIGTAHEIGHNFNSPHAHCYGGLGGNAAPIDQCNGGEAGSGCHAGLSSLPGPQGQGSGTIMSYCHLLGGGLSNISLNFGLDHPFGVAPERQAVRMAAHVANRAAANPGCLAPLPAEIFVDGFETP